MDAERWDILTESLRLCDKLLQEHELDRDRIVVCLSGDLRRAYLESTDIAVQEILKVRNELQAMLP